MSTCIPSGFALASTSQPTLLRSRKCVDYHSSKQADSGAFKMPKSSVPKPGPAKLTANAGLDEWLEEAKQCHYLPEPVMKQLCEIVKEVLMEGMS